MISTGELETHQQHVYGQTVQEYPGVGVVIAVVDGRPPKLLQEA